jgi:hypothetical protein
VQRNIGKWLRHHRECVGFLIGFSSSVSQIGGCENGGYVNDASQSNPTYEFFPSTGPPIASPIPENTLPTNLYPLTWLLPSGNLLIQSNFETAILNYKTNIQTSLENIPSAIRTYSASTGTAMLPLTPGNNWTATIIFGGGVNLQPTECVPFSHGYLRINRPFAVGGTRKKRLS